MTDANLGRNCGKIGFMKKIIIIVILCILVITVTINIIVVRIADPLIVESDEAQRLATTEGAYDCIMVLGASVSQQGPSPILANRLNTGLELFDLGVSNIILLSGDNGTIYYNEVKGMKDYILERGADIGLEASNIYLDYAGFSTHASVIRSKDIFEAKRIVIVTQRYHLYRAVFIAKMSGLDVIGVASEDISHGQFERDAREVPARLKDFFLTLFGYTPSVMGDPVPLEYPSTQ
jgi:Uncharacterized membrane protein